MKKPSVNVKVNLKGKNANKFILTGMKARLKECERKIVTLKEDLANLVPEAPLHIEEQIVQEIQNMEDLSKDLIEGIQGLEKKC